MYKYGVLHFEALWADRWVLFDMDKVLISFDRKLVSSKLLEYMSKNESPPSPNLKHEAIHNFFFDVQTTGLSRKDELDLGRHKLDWLRSEFCKAFPCSIDPITFRGYWNSIFDKVDPEALSCMQQLREMRGKVGICSNTIEIHWLCIESKYPEFINAADDFFW